MRGTVITVVGIFRDVVYLDYCVRLYFVFYIWFFFYLLVISQNFSPTKCFTVSDLQTIFASSL